MRSEAIFDRVRKRGTLEVAREILATARGHT